MDIGDTTAPKSDQQNYDDYAGGIVRTVTIAETRVVGGEQPVEIHLVEFPGRPYKPNKTMRRVLVAAWGEKSAVYAGRLIELGGDPNVKWGGQPVGGIVIRGLSHIEKPLKIRLAESKGKRTVVEVQPIAAPAPAPQVDVAAETDVDALRAAWQTADPDTRKAIEARVTELTKGAESDG